MSAILAIIQLVAAGLPVAQELLTLGEAEYAALTGGPALTATQQASIDAAYAASVTALQAATPAA